jgi:hypothetical protein
MPQPQSYIVQPYAAPVHQPGLRLARGSAASPPATEISPAVGER